MGDEFEIAVNMVSLTGIVNTVDLRWELPTIDDTSKILGKISGTLRNAPMDVQSLQMDAYKSAV